MLHFCTLFDTNFMARGIALYRSLSKNTRDFRLYILACDEQCRMVLKEFGLQHAEIIALSEFEDTALLQVKDKRTLIEYFWTCSSSLILYCIQKYKLEMCTYLDADLYFYQDPGALTDEMGDHDVLITEHRFLKSNDHSSLRGRFNVQFMTFKNNDNGLNVLKKWRDDCIEWCYDKVEDGKYGDQKYLDAWPDAYQGIHILEHSGGGVATWNINNYLIEKSDSIILTEKKTGRKSPLIFYHFHAVKFYNNNVVMLSDNKLSQHVKSVIYFPYIRDLLMIDKEIKEKGYHINALGKIKDDRTLLNHRDMIYIFRKELFPFLMKLKIRKFISSYKYVMKKYRNRNFYLFNNESICIKE